MAISDFLSSPFTEEELPEETNILDSLSALISPEEGLISPEKFQAAIFKVLPEVQRVLAEGKLGQDFVKAIKAMFRLVEKNPEGKKLFKDTAVTFVEPMRDTSAVVNPQLNKMSIAIPEWAGIEMPRELRGPSKAIVNNFAKELTGHEMLHFWEKDPARMSQLLKLYKESPPELQALISKITSSQEDIRRLMGMLRWDPQDVIEHSIEELRAGEFGAYAWNAARGHFGKHAKEFREIAKKYPEFAKTLQELGTIDIKSIKADPILEWIARSNTPPKYPRPVIDILDNPKYTDSEVKKLIEDLQKITIPSSKKGGVTQGTRTTPPRMPPPEPSEPPTPEMLKKALLNKSKQEATGRLKLYDPTRPVEEPTSKVVSVGARDITTPSIREADKIWIDEFVSSVFPNHPKKRALLREALEKRLLKE